MPNERDDVREDQLAVLRFGEWENGTPKAPIRRVLIYAQIPDKYDRPYLAVCVQVEKPADMAEYLKQRGMSQYELVQTDMCPDHHPEFYEFCPRLLEKAIHIAKVMDIDIIDLGVASKEAVEAAPEVYKSMYLRQFGWR